ncbi:MAG: hypothetical protein HQ581_03530 [Planctomycetes bacterium]|nr:hypothetical protein [Planctomycetota bacterium]
MKKTTVKPTQKPVKQYYQALEEFAAQDVSHEMAVRSAFQHLLEDTGRRFGCDWRYSSAKRGLRVSRNLPDSVHCWRSSGNTCA